MVMVEPVARQSPFSALRESIHLDPGKRRPGAHAAIIRRAHLDDATIAGAALVVEGGHPGAHRELGGSPLAVALAT